MTLEHGLNNDRQDFECRTPDSAGIDDLYRSVPTPRFRMLERVPLSCGRITLGEGYDEANQGENVQGNAESQDGYSEPRPGSEDADDQDSYA